MKRVNFDHNATTALRPQVRARLAELQAATLGNPSSVHASGRAARALLDEARAQAAAALRVREDELAFTGGATEALHLALHGAHRARGGGVVATSVEHHAVLGAVRHLAARGVPTALVPVDQRGRVDPEAVVAATRTVGAGVVAVQLANNELGTIQPIAAIRAALRAAGLQPTLVVDAAQAPGRIACDPRALEADMAAFSAHKFGGPVGVGLLWVRTGTAFVPLGDGEGQEHGWRPGTEPVAGIAATSLALELAQEEQPTVAEAMKGNCRLLWSQLTANVPGLRLHGPALDDPDRLPNTLNIGASGVDGRTLVARLDLEGLECSAGSACASGSLEPSHVMLACGFAREEARAALRLSLGRDTSAEDVHIAVDILRRTFSSPR